MLGVPYDDHEFFQEHANAGLARYAAADAMQKGAMSLHQYLINLVEEKQANPAEDAVSDLAEVHWGPPRDVELKGVPGVHTLHPVLAG